MTVGNNFYPNRELKGQLYDPSRVDYNSDGGIILRAYPRPSNEQFAEALFNPSKGTGFANDQIPSPLTGSTNLNPPSNRGPSGISVSPLAGVYAALFAGRIFKGHCQDNQRTNADLGLNRKDMGILERIGIRNVKVRQVTINDQLCMVAFMPRLKNSAMQVIAGPSYLMGKTVKNLNGKNWDSDGLNQFNAMEKELKRSQEAASELSPKNPTIKDPPIKKEPSLETLPKNPPASLEKPKVSDVLSLSAPDSTITQDKKDLRQALDENKKVLADPEATLEKKKNSLKKTSEIFDEFFWKTGALHPNFFKGPRKQVFEACQKLLDQAEVKRDSHRNLMIEGTKDLQLAKDHASKSAESEARGDLSKKAEHDVKAIEYQKLGMTKHQEGLHGAIFYGMQTGALEELRCQVLVLPRTLQSQLASNCVDTLCNLAEERLIEGKVDLQKAATGIVVNTVVGTIFQVGATVAHSAIAAGISEYSQEVADKVPGISTCGKVARAGYTFYTAKTYTEGVSNVIWVVCDDSIELAVVSGATGALALTPLAPLSPVLGPAIGRGAWRAAKIGCRYFCSGSAVPNA